MSGKIKDKLEDDHRRRTLYTPSRPTDEQRSRSRERRATPRRASRRPTRSSARMVRGSDGDRSRSRSSRRPRSWARHRACSRTSSRARRRPQDRPSSRARHYARSRASRRSRSERRRLRDSRSRGSRRSCFGTSDRACSRVRRRVRSRSSHRAHSRTSSHIPEHQPARHEAEPLHPSKQTEDKYVPLRAKLVYAEHMSSEMLGLFDDSNLVLEFPSIDAVVKMGALETASKSTIHSQETTNDRFVAAIKVLEKGLANASEVLNSNVTKPTLEIRYIDYTTKSANLLRTHISHKAISANDHRHRKSHTAIPTNLHSTTIPDTGTEENNGSVALNGTNDINENPTQQTFTILPLPDIPFSCPESELPSNIGPYEVPTQRDVVLHIANHLKLMYHGFHHRAMFFLKDVKEATQASWSRKVFCSDPTELMHYRRCVRWVGKMSVLTTKSLVTALETARHKIINFARGKICNISALNPDPIHLIRILAAEKVSLEFALPDFLRQLNACTKHCPRSILMASKNYLKTEHLTDQDYVIRHYLTQQNFNHQFKKHYKN